MNRAITMQVFSVRHKKTGNLLPFNYQASGIFWNGEAGKTPRFFSTAHGAKQFVYQWKLGEGQARYMEQEVGPSEYPVEHREHSHLEVVPFDLEEKEPFDA